MTDSLELKLLNNVKKLYFKYNITKIFVAFSGGLDSTVLLFIIQKIINKNNFNIELEAIHINHNISSNAQNWQNFCTNFCKQFNINFYTTKINKSLNLTTEEDFRQYRYEVFVQKLQNHKKHCLITAHHTDDRIETFFINLLRGCGLNGLSSIPIMRKLGKSMVYRIFLDSTKSLINKKIINQYAIANKLQWITDESNFENKYNRNLIRNKLLPIISKRWNKYSLSINSSIDLINQQKQLINELITSKLVQISRNNNLNLNKLLKSTINLQKQLIHSWIKKQTNINLTNKQVIEIIKICQTGHGLFKFKNLELQVYRNFLEIIESNNLDDFKPIHFILNDSKTFNISHNNRTIKIDLRKYKIGNEFFISNIKDKKSNIMQLNHLNKKLKKVFQEQAISKWQRKNYLMVQHKFINKTDTKWLIVDIVKI